MAEERKRILILEDEPDIVDLIRSVLAEEGYEVVSAHNGEEGLKVLKDVNPHLILLDMNMPKMGGVAFYHQIYDKRKERPTYPVLVLTGRADMEKLFTELNVDGFMTKPFEIDDLLREVKIILTKRYHARDGEGRAFNPLQRKVLLVESDRAHFDPIALVFLNEGFIVNGAVTALKAVERAMGDRPDLIVVRLQLPDMPGDILACKFKQMPKTMAIPIVLYGALTDTMDWAMTQQICQKVGLNPVDTLDPQILLAKGLEILAGTNR